MLKPDDKKKAESIILDHIRKNPKTSPEKIQAALKDRLNIPVSSMLLSKWVYKVRKSEGIPMRRKLNSNEKVKALSIILDHIKKNPKAKVSDIQAALKDQHQITVSLSAVTLWTKKIRNG
ncbi:PREDICTED: uncharacterized protein LOC105559495, partial [Vollenhovia emeryi]|uniref:uncharacterized protein LOC105559495 n=1 Tax=Vollenhovia emeryi TaxID=411798 RepID=UPI0005F430A3